MTKRERPADGGIMWREELDAFECYGCGEFEEIRRAHDREPDKLAELKDLLIADHTECWEFDDPRMAAEARRYRSERKRRALLQGSRQLSALSCQRVSWRGR
jgi:hypothetical protein